jgi:hypothetical protein
MMYSGYFIPDEKIYVLVDVKYNSQNYKFIYDIHQIDLSCSTTEQLSAVII